MNVKDIDKWKDVVSRTLVVLIEDEHADENAELIGELRALLKALGGSNYGPEADARFARYLDNKYPRTAPNPVTPTVDPLAIYQAVAERLTDLGATLEYPGYVSVPVRPNYLTAFGTVNNPWWTGELTDLDGNNLLGLDVRGEIPTDSTDVEAIATGIRDAVRRVKGCVLDLHDYDSPENLDGGSCRTCGTSRHRSRTF